MLQKLIINTTKKRQVIDITKILNDLLMKNSYYDGLCFLFCLHTTCAVTTADLDPGGTDEDYMNAYESMMPKIAFKHPHDPGHFPEHLFASTIGSSLFVPVQSASLVLGMSQKIALIEFSGPGERRILFYFIKERFDFREVRSIFF